jgi:hypothetical protein
MRWGTPHTVLLSSMHAPTDMWMYQYKSRPTQPRYNQYMTESHIWSSWVERPERAGRAGWATGLYSSIAVPVLRKRTGMQGKRSSSQLPGRTTALHRSSTTAASSPTQEQIPVCRSCNQGSPSSSHGGTRYQYPTVGWEVVEVGLVEPGSIAQRPSYFETDTSFVVVSQPPYRASTI